MPTATGDKFTKPSAFSKPSSYSNASVAAPTSFSPRPPQSAYVKPFANKFPPVSSQGAPRPSYQPTQPSVVRAPASVVQVPKIEPTSVVRSAVSTPMTQATVVRPQVPVLTPPPGVEPRELQQQAPARMSLDDLARSANGIVDRSKSTGKNIGTLKMRFKCTKPT